MTSASTLRRIGVLLAACLGAVNIGVCAAQSIVTLCESDDQAGPGLNLTHALGIGPAGEVLLGIPEQVRFQCNGPARIRITHVHELFQNFDIEGGGAVTLDAGGTASMFRLRDAGRRLRLTGLTLTGAGGTTPPAGFIFRDPGAPEGEPLIELVDCSVENNAFGIEVGRGTVHAVRTRFLGNTTFAMIVAAHVNLEDASFIGNAAHPIFSGSEVAITRSTFADNLASLLFGCRANIVDSRFVDSHDRSLLIAGCTVTIRRSVFDNNRAADGAALYLIEGNEVTVDGSTFSNNVASNRGGAIFVDCWTGTAAQTIHLRRSVFRANQASAGGAIHLGEVLLFAGSDSTLDAVSVLFQGNTATTDGGAIAGTHAAAGIAGGVFIGNQAGGSGGALALYQRGVIGFGAPGSPIFFRFAPPHQTVLANGLLVQNSAAVTGSAFVGTDVLFVNTSVARNNGFAVATSAYGTAAFLNALFLANSASNCDTRVAGASYADRGHNLQFPGTTCGSSISVGDAALDDVFVPVAGSPAIAHGDTAACLAPPVNARDVFGRVRPEGNACTIGAVEGDIEQALRRRKEGRPKPQP